MSKLLGSPTKLQQQYQTFFNLSDVFRWSIQLWWTGDGGGGREDEVGHTYSLVIELVSAGHWSR